MVIFLQLRSFGCEKKMLTKLHVQSLGLGISGMKQQNKSISTENKNNKDIPAVITYNTVYMQQKDSQCT